MAVGESKIDDETYTTKTNDGIRVGRGRSLFTMQDASKASAEPSCLAGAGFVLVVAFLGVSLLPLAARTMALRDALTRAGPGTLLRGEHLSSSADGQLRLTDHQVRSFVATGFLLLDVGMHPSFHNQTAETAERIVMTDLAEKVDKNGLSIATSNNLSPLMPNATRVMQSPTVRGALTSLLGPGYLMHAHRHLHTPQEGIDQVWHKDSYWGTRRSRHHRPRWLMALYFPRRVTMEMVRRRPEPTPPCRRPAPLPHACGMPSARGAGAHAHHALLSIRHRRHGARGEGRGPAGSGTVSGGGPVPLHGDKRGGAAVQAR